MTDRILNWKTARQQLIFFSDIGVRRCYYCNSLFSDTDFKNDNWNIYFTDRQSINWIDFPQDSKIGNISVEIVLLHDSCPKLKPKPEPKGDFTIKDYPI